MPSPTPTRSYCTPKDLIWPTGIDNFRTQFTAGYSTIPEDVQEACAELVASYFKQFDRNQLLALEIAGGIHTTPLPNASNWPQSVRTLLAPYRQLRVMSNQS